ncbi:MAG: Aldo/keto reductase [Candidatus Saccharibacteria bacterium]|nr:Aldo/keto reductase [Candidatus Saccharibacteria bacterium]
MALPEITLNTGKNIPQIGLGVWQVKDDQEFQTAFDAAAKAGYRHFDSAQFYENEHLLGNAWKNSGLPREEFFLTTKIALANFKPAKVAASFEESLKKLQSDYVDLLLLHFPVTILRKNAWKALEQIYAEGGAKSIGVSNYTIRHLKEMKKYAKITPAVNQIELHVFLQQPELIEYCQNEGIVVEAYSPLAHSQDMNDQTVQKIADKYGKTYAQIMLRWLVQKGLVILPKSVTPSRIVENISIFDFEISDQDMAVLDTLDKDLRTCWSPVYVP